MNRLVKLLEGQPPALEPEGWRERVLSAFKDWTNGLAPGDVPEDHIDYFIEEYGDDPHYGVSKERVTEYLKHFTIESALGQ